MSGTNRSNIGQTKLITLNWLVVVIMAHYGSITTRQKCKGTSSMDYRERGSHARGVYPTQYTSRIESTRVK